VSYFFCVTVNVWPAIVRVPVRLLPVLLLATVNLTEPFPVPLDPLVIVIQFAVLTAVHVQLGCVVTDTGPPLPPSLSTPSLVGEMEYMQPLCEIATGWPATVNVPVRAVPVFA
jgi:hypothetical protein